MPPPPLIPLHPDESLVPGKLEGFRKLSDRVSKLEIGQAWLKGGWAALAAAWAYLWKAKGWN